MADRVLVVFTDGEAHDELPEVVAAADRLRRAGIRLIVVGQGEAALVPIPLRGPDGRITGYQMFEGRPVRTQRRDDVLAAVADAAQGVVVAAAVEDQAGSVRELVRGYRRAPQTTVGMPRQVSRAWLPLLAATVLLLVQAWGRRTAALVVLALMVGAPPAAAQGPRNPADDAWRAGAFSRALTLYRLQARAGEGGAHGNPGIGGRRAGPGRGRRNPGTPPCAPQSAA